MCIRDRSSGAPEETTALGDEFGPPVTASGAVDGIDFGLDPEMEPWENFDLDDWSLDSPAGRVAPENVCQSVRIDEDEWEDIEEPGNTTRPYIFTHTDGGMRFVSPVDGVTTSQSCFSGFPRSELREMLRRGDRSISTQGPNGNNWALGYQPGENTGHGGRNGVLAATLIVNQVTVTGTVNNQPGRTIIGQIHAEDDEPARLYYRVLPGDEFGCVYVESEMREGNDTEFPIIGGENCNNPSNGIRLGELFSYELINEGADITVIVRRGDADGPIINDVTFNLDDINAGYDIETEWMYFKAGAYTQNNTGEPGDGDVITFYRLSNEHDDN